MAESQTNKRSTIEFIGRQNSLYIFNHHSDDER